MSLKFESNRYDKMLYRRCGNSGILLPAISLGLWQNFGKKDDYKTSLKMIHTAFDLGITHFDLANNYGPSPGSAELRFGKILRSGLSQYRDELIISTKAGYLMWPGPYGDWGSGKHLISSLDQSLKRMKLDYVDIFYHHRSDPNTPLEETMGALDHIVKQGKALYAGISNYNAEQTKKAYAILKKKGTPCLINQVRYNMFDRWIEKDLIETLNKLGMGSIIFSPLAQGILSNKYLRGIPKISRAAKECIFLTEKDITEERINIIKQLNEIAIERNQSIAQLAIAWILRHQNITSVLAGASNVQQIKENVNALNSLNISKEDLSRINNILISYKTKSPT